MNNEPKIILALVLYFITLSFIVTLILGTASHYGLSTSGFDTSGGSLGLDGDRNGSGNPRFATGSVGGSQSLFSPWVLHDVSAKPLMEAGLIYDDVSCESYPGFSWESFTSFFGWGIGSVTCRGLLNTTELDPTGNWSRGNTFSQQSDDYVCDLPALSESQQEAERYGCTWYDGTLSLDYEFSDSVGAFSNIWTSLKQIFTLQLNFGLSNTAIAGLLNLLLIVFPLLILVIYVIIFFRKIIGIT